MRPCLDYLPCIVCLYAVCSYQRCLDDLMECKLQVGEASARLVLLLGSNGGTNGRVTETRKFFEGYEWSRELSGELQAKVNTSFTSA